MDIRQHPLAWRWTDSKYAELPPNILAQITPIDVETAAALHDQWISYFDKYGEVIADRFASVDACPTEGTWKGDSCSRESHVIADVTDWLRSREADTCLSVVVSWKRECGVRTTWGIFTQWWDDFCYAASDDVFIVPDVPRWFLSFNHEDWFYFCREPSV